MREVLRLYAGTLAYASVQYALTMYVKEGHYKYVISHLEYLNSLASYGQQPLEPVVINGMFDKQWRALRIGTAHQFLWEIARLQAFMGTARPATDDF